MFAAIAIAAALVAPTGDYNIGTGIVGSEPVICDSSTVPVQEGNAIVCVALGGGYNTVLYDGYSGYGGFDGYRRGLAFNHLGFGEHHHHCTVGLAGLCL